MKISAGGAIDRVEFQYSVRHLHLSGQLAHPVEVQVVQGDMP